MWREKCGYKCQESVNYMGTFDNNVRESVEIGKIIWHIYVLDLLQKLISKYLLK
jgi:hypothetical protein